jgi:hypothetical protein
MLGYFFADLYATRQEWMKHKVHNLAPVVAEASSWLLLPRASGHAACDASLQDELLHHVVAIFLVSSGFGLEVFHPTLRAARSLHLCRTPLFFTIDHSRLTN